MYCHLFLWFTVYILSRSVHVTAVMAESALSAHNFYAIMDDETLHDAWLIKHVRCSRSAVRCAHLAPIFRRTFRSNPVQHCALTTFRNHEIRTWGYSCYVSSVLNLICPQPQPGRTQRISCRCLVAKLRHSDYMPNKIMFSRSIMKRTQYNE